MKRIATLLLAAAAGCSYFSSSPQPGTAEGDWAAERDRYTRERKVYDILADVAFATATYEAPSVRAARVNRLAEWKKMLPAERDALLSQERAEAAQFEEFLLAFYTNDRRANDLTADHSTWRVALVVEGKEAPPVKVEVVLLDPTLQILYPYVNAFYRVYRVRFPHYPGDKPLSDLAFDLRIAGAPGKVEMEWRPGPP